MADSRESSRRRGGGMSSAPIYQTYGKLIAEKTAPWGQSNIPHKDLSLFTATAQAVESINQPKFTDAGTLINGDFDVFVMSGSSR